MMVYDYLLDNKVTFSPHRFMVFTANRIIKISKKEASLLRMLCAADPLLVERKELIQEIWPGLADADSNLNKCVLLLRRKLTSLGLDINSIATVPRLGYRLSLPLTAIPVDISSRVSSLDMTSITVTTSPFCFFRKNKFSLILASSFFIFLIAALFFKDTKGMVAVEAVNGVSGRLFYTRDIRSDIGSELFNSFDTRVGGIIGDGVSYYALISRHAISIILMARFGHKNEVVLLRKKNESVVDQLECAAKIASEKLVEKTPSDQRLHNSSDERFDMFFINDCISSSGVFVNVHQVKNHSTAQTVQHYVIESDDRNEIASFSRVASISPGKNDSFIFDYSKSSIELIHHTSEVYSPVVNKLVFDLTPKVIVRWPLDYKNDIYYSDLLGGILYHKY